LNLKKEERKWEIEVNARKLRFKIELTSHRECEAEYDEKVDIVPFSLAMKMASKMIRSDLYTEHKHWRWLAGHWRGKIGPDITISVHRHDISLKDRDIVRVCSQNTKTLLVAAGDAIGSAGGPFTTKQLRRITLSNLLPSLC